MALSLNWEITSNKERSKKTAIDSREAYLYRITDHCITGEKNAVEAAKGFITKLYYESKSIKWQSDSIYDAIEGMPQTEKKNLEAALKIEWGVTMKTYNYKEKNAEGKRENKKGIELTGILYNKAFEMIYFHPLIWFEIR